MVAIAPMIRHRARRFALVVLSMCFAVTTAQAGTRQLVLTANSSIVVLNGTSTKPESLSGSLEITTLPAQQQFGVAAITNVQLSSAHFQITGNGFVQRL